MLEETRYGNQHVLKLSDMCCLRNKKNVILRNRLARAGSDISQEIATRMGK